MTAGASRASCGDELPRWSSVLAQGVVMVVMMAVAVVVEAGQWSGRSLIVSGGVFDLFEKIFLTRN